MMLVFFRVDCLLDGSCLPVFLKVQCRKRSHTAEHCWKYNDDFDWEHEKVLKEESWGSLKFSKTSTSC